MAQIKPGRYSDEPKGFLTYNIIGERDTTGIQSVLLTERKNTVYRIESGDTKIHIHRVTKKLANALENVGVKTFKTMKIGTEGRRILTVFKEGNPVNLPVEIRKSVEGGKLIEIEIRATGKTPEDLLKNIDAIKKALSVWHIKPRQCVWSQGQWKEITAKKEPIVNETEIEKEMRRLRDIVQSQAYDLAEIKEASIKKAIRSDREVMKGILD